jgi:hypothetical protein
VRSGSAAGLAGKLSRRAHQLSRQGIEKALERRYRVDTSGFVYLDTLGLDAEGRVWHDPSEWLGLRRALRRLSPSSDDVFIDFGSGKGRAVFVAALHFPFKRVGGVELSPDLTRAAQSNIERNRPRLRCQNIDLVTADVLDYDIPPDLTLAYLYSPFTGKLFDAAVERLIASVDAHPRLLRIVYNYPFEHARLLETGRVEVVDVQPSQWPGRGRSSAESIVTYAIVPRRRVERVERVRAEASRRLRGAQHWRGPYDPGFVLERPGVVITPTHTG